MLANRKGDPFLGSVLIVDDDDDFRHLLVRRANRMGLNVFEADDGDRALETLNEKRIDVLVVDLYMPGCTGLELVQHAHKLDPEIQAIMLTGSATVETAVEAFRAGVYDYLTKPLESLAAFEMVLTRALEHHFLVL